MNVQIIPSGVMTVFYFDRLIALIDEVGRTVWRDPNYPVYLVEYLIERPYLETYQWN